MSYAAEMTNPESDLESRLPVWDELQMIFMHGDPALFLDSMTDVCARSPYTIEELEQILFNEVLPACRFNLLAGDPPERQGFDAEWLKARILKKHRFGRKRPWLHRAYAQGWWSRLSPLVVERRGSVTFKWSPRSARRKA